MKSDVFYDSHISNYEDTQKNKTFDGFEALREI